ncbi:MAG TPA: ubiquinol-cytochrome c reductase iron-sulfur subunit [Dehalococcoidia bacterium]|nr:ubiquinol-cytochrome c reductase iron-sulfur subunit [Dehalococcoidia bacterium]
MRMVTKQEVSLSKHMMLSGHAALGGTSTMENKKTEMSRRTFLACATAGTGLILCGGIGCAAAITYQATVVNGRISMNRSEFQQLDGEPIIVTAPGLPYPLVLIQVDVETFRAVSAKCTHLGCHVRPSKNFLVCPCHGSTYNLEGEVVRGPAQRALTIYPVEVKGDEIRIII